MDLVCNHDPSTSLQIMSQKPRKTYLAISSYFSPALWLIINGINRILVGLNHTGGLENLTARNKIYINVDLKFLKK